MTDIYSVPDETIGNLVTKVNPISLMTLATANQTVTDAGDFEQSLDIALRGVLSIAESLQDSIDTKPEFAVAYDDYVMFTMILDILADKYRSEHSEDAAVIPFPVPTH